MLVADDRYLAVDGGTDLPGDWNLRELACVAAWHGVERGGVLATAGGFFHDSYEGATGVRWPGIESNEQLAKNVLRYLSEGRPCDSAEDRCKRIEINLADFVLGVLRAAGDDWWQAAVPEKIRQACEERRRLEGRGLLPAEAYLDLIHLKTLMETNWPLFSHYLEAVVGPGGKRKSLTWLAKLNSLRTFVGHPLKKHVAGYTFSVEEQALLREADRAALRLREALAHAASRS